MCKGGHDLKVDPANKDLFKQYLKRKYEGKKWFAAGAIATSAVAPMVNFINGNTVQITFGVTINYVAKYAIQNISS